MDSSCFTKNFNEIMKEKNLSAFSRKSGVKESTLRSYKNGVLPRLDSLIAIAKTAEVNLLWLATGEGPMQTGVKEIKGDFVERLVELQKDFPEMEITAKPRLEREGKTETQVDKGRRSQKIA